MLASAAGGALLVTGRAAGSPVFWALVALALGLLLFWRGLMAYRRRTIVAGIATSRIETLAAGEVRLVGTIRAAESLLPAPLAGTECVYYRTTISRPSADGRHRDTEVLTSSTGFLLDDGSGLIRVFPRGADWDVPDGYVHTAIRDPLAGLSAEDRAATIDRLAASGIAARDEIELAAAMLDPIGFAMGGRPPVGPGSYVPVQGDAVSEKWLQPGDRVTLIGTALPYRDLDEDASGDPLGTDDPVIAAELAEARAAGLVEDNADAAWGNAAIPGFGIGRPVRPPHLEPQATPPPDPPAMTPETALPPSDDPVILAELAAARQAGLVAASPEAAWGNAAIPGFGIGKPVRPPVLDPGVQGTYEEAPRRPQTFERTGLDILTGGGPTGLSPAALVGLAMTSATDRAPGGAGGSDAAALVGLAAFAGLANVSASGAAAAAITAPGQRSASAPTGSAAFALTPDTTVVAAGPDRPLQILAGTPGQAIARADSGLLVGIAGAVLASAAAITLALMLGGQL